MRSRRLTLRLFAASALCGALAAGWAFGEFVPVLHEHFEPDAKEDLAAGVVVTSAGLPAAINAETGPVPIPDPKRAIDRKEPTYGERLSDTSPNFRIDPETTDPGPLSYHEPFRPSIAPFKRTHVFDAVNSDFELVVANPQAKPVTVGGTPGGSDEFFGDVVLELDSEQKIRIPSVGPHMTVFSAHLEPERPFGFYVDGAENWFLRAPDGRGRARLVMHVGVPRAVFNGRIEATSYSTLNPHMPPVPANVQRAASKMLERLGVSAVLAPADALAQLVNYFRSFTESKERLKATEGEPLYRELVLSRKGVCRHRAYAFVVTAMGLRIPARFVHNEAHAWVEVFGGQYWHRIDLGGASPDIQYRGEPPQGPPHQPPSEAYAWPKSRPAQRSLAPSTPTPSPSATQTADPGSAQQPSPPPGAAPDASASTTSLDATLPTPDSVAKGRARIVASLGASSDVQRGHLLGVSGQIETADGECGDVRVDLTLVRAARRIPIGSTATDPNGRFSTKVTVPAGIPVGDYQLELSSPGSKRCPPASTM